MASVINKVIFFKKMVTLLVSKEISLCQLFFTKIRKCPEEGWLVVGRTKTKM